MKGASWTQRMFKLPVRLEHSGQQSAIQQSTVRPLTISITTTGGTHVQQLPNTNAFYGPSQIVTCVS